MVLRTSPSFRHAVQRTRSNHRRSSSCVLLAFLAVLGSFAFVVLTTSMSGVSYKVRSSQTRGGDKDEARMQKMLIEIPATAAGTGAQAMEKEEEAPTSPFFRSKMTLSETLSGVYNRLSGGVEEEDVRFENYRQHKLDAYMSLRGAQCDETKRWISMDMAREGMINGYLYGNHSAAGAREERYLSMTTCAIEAKDGKSGWQVYRVGPFVGSGGYDWHQAFVHPLPKPPKAKFLTGKLAAPVTISGDIIGYPPIYSHHVHTKVNGIEHVLESHGDTTCAKENGGKACYMHTYPEGYGLPFNGAKEDDDYLSLDFLLIDKREFPAPPMVFFKEIAVRWSSEDNLTPISTAMLHAHASKGSPFATTMVAQRPSLMWNTGTWITDGKVLISPRDQLPWFHAHKPYFRAMWAFAARPEDLGLTRDLLQKVDDQINNMKPRDYDYVWAPDGEDPVEALKNRINGSEAGWDSLRCWLAPGEGERILERVEATDSSAEYPEAWNQNWKGNWYDRAGEVHCKPWSFKKGDHYTIVTLNGVHDEMKDQNILTLQHNGFWMVYESEGPEVGPNFEVYGPYTSNETVEYFVSSSWLKPNGSDYLAGGIPIETRLAAIPSDTKFHFNFRNSTAMYKMMARMFSHNYYLDARSALISSKTLKA